MYQSLPNFGTYKAKRQEIISEYKKSVDILKDVPNGEPVRPAVQPKKDVPKLQVCSVM